MLFESWFQILWILHHSEISEYIHFVFLIIDIISLVHFASGTQWSGFPSIWFITVDWFFMPLACKKIKSCLLTHLLPEERTVTILANCSAATDPVGSTIRMILSVMYRQSEGSLIRGFDNPILTVMWLGFFDINASSGLFNVKYRTS